MFIISGLIVYSRNDYTEAKFIFVIDEIFFNLRHLDIEDVAYHLVKFDPKLADKLASAIEHNFFEKDLKK
jgi:hypothetical protein